MRSVYDSLGRVVWQSARYKTTTTTDGVGNITSFDNTTVAPTANETFYNSLGQAYSTQEYKNVSLTIALDTNAGGATIYAVTPPSGLTPQSSKFVSSTQVWFDDQGRAIETKNAAGLRMGTIYNADGSVAFTGPLNTTAPDGGRDSDGTITFTAPSGNSTGDFASYSAYLYNQLDTSTGNPWSGLLYDNVIDADGHQTDTYQTADGLTTFTVYDDGSFTETIKSVGDQAISGYTVIPAGTATAVLPAIPAGGSETINIAQRNIGDTAVYTIDIYDAAGNLVAVWQPQVADPAHSGQMTNPEWIYTYDESGNEVSQTDPNGGVTSFGYDENGNKIIQTMPDGEMQTWTYDQFGNLILHKVYGEANGTTDTTAGQTTWDIYDASNDGAGGQLLAEYRYDSDFTPSDSGTTYADTTSYQEKTVYTYDDLGRQNSVTDYVDPNGTATVSTYTDYTYDPITGGESSITTPQGTINYIYNEATGQLIETWTGTTHANATTDIQYGYNTLGQLATITQVKLNGSAATGTTTYTYDAAGNLLSESDPNGMTTVFTYDDLNRILTETVTHGSTNLFAQTYEYYANGLRKDETDTHYSGGSELSQIKYQWTYDNDGRLTEEALTLLYNLTGNTQVPTAYTNDFSYDLNNNRVEEDLIGGTTGNGTVDYTYNADDQLKTETGTFSNSSQDYSTTYGYDANGNLSTETRTGNGATTNSYTYDLRNRMTQVTINNTTTNYSYDTNGVLVSETTGSTTTTYLNDPNNPTGYTKAIQTVTSVSGTTTSTRSYVLGLGVVAQSDSSTGMAYLLRDGHGSTRALISAAGAVISGQIFDYSAFSDALDFDPSAAQTDWLANGDGLYDPASGWTYHLARWTNGFWFTQQDTITQTPGDLANANLYLYVGGNPLNGRDPTGRFLGLAVGLVSVLASTAINLTYQAFYTIPRVVPVLAAATVAAAGVFAASSLALQLIDWGYLPKDQQQYIQAVQYYSGIGFVVSWTALEFASGVPDVKPASNYPPASRLAQDEAVDGNPSPAPLPANRPVAQNSAINAEKDADVARLQAQGASQIRVDQRQSAWNGTAYVQKGLNRPDTQGLFTNKPSIAIEYDTNLNNLLVRRARILANDPTVQVILKWFDSHGNYTIVP